MDEDDDYLPCDDCNGHGYRGQHIKGDVLKVCSGKNPEWDLMIAHPPCTYLSVSGARWWKDRVKEQSAAIAFARKLGTVTAIPKVAIENPIGILSRVWRKPDQIVQPWMFGHGETKATCLWLKNLPLLKPTNIVEGREGRCWRESPGKKNGLTRQQRRSITYQGIADAMAEQWG
jgi:hypothetical protein